MASETRKPNDQRQRFSAHSGCVIRASTWICQWDFVIRIFPGNIPIACSAPTAALWRSKRYIVALMADPPHEIEPPWQFVLEAGAVQSGRAVPVQVGDLWLAICNDAGTYHAVNNLCPH